MSKNEELFARAQRHIPGGVNSPVRAFRSVGGTPCFFERALGARVWDADGREYIDYVGSWGPMIVGHSHPEVLQAVYERAARGLSFGAPTGLEVEMADLLVELVPSMDMVRLTSSGTEATMSAIRLARGPYRARQDHQIRGLLPWSRRLAAGQGGLWCVDIRSAQFRRGAC